MEIIDEKNPSRDLSIKEWFLTIFITAIPLIGFIMLFVWAFGDNTPKSKANWAKATLLWFLVGIIIYGFIALVFGAAMFAGLAQ